MVLRSRSSTTARFSRINLTKPIAPKTKVILQMGLKRRCQLQNPPPVARINPDHRRPVQHTAPVASQGSAEYDWRRMASPLISPREFYGVWGDFDVTIHIDKTLKLEVQLYW